MAGSFVTLAKPTSVPHPTARPEDVAFHCRHAQLPGLVWLDSAVAGAGARSLIAACPDAILAGAPGNWPEFEKDLAAFQQANPQGAAIGWVEYEGSFRFGFYPRPLLLDHDTGQWFFPGGTPEWLEGEIQPQSPLPSWRGRLSFNFQTTAEQFCHRVQSAQEHIAAGDIYQVNLAHQVKAHWPVDGDAFALYLALRAVSPAPQAAFLALDEQRTVLSSSPEEFLVFARREVRTRPIKGTRPRGITPAGDRAAGRELLASAKERAELLMITDLLRNDLGQFCEYGSVRVRELLQLEQFAQVFHLVSTIEGRLRAGVSHAGALQMCMPGGSITGAPKRRAREIVTQLEDGPRGLYTGAIGAFLGEAGSRFNIAIRTLIIEGGKAHFHVGAGIVADSDPQMEWEETLHKAAGILAASGVNHEARTPLPTGKPG